jgi:hypothetical protein
VQATHQKLLSGGVAENRGLHLRRQVLEALSDLADAGVLVADCAPMSKDWRQAEL